MGIFLQKANLSCGLNTLPNAEVANDPGQDETQDQLPPQAAHLLNTTGDFQNTAPGQKRVSNGGGERESKKKKEKKE